MSRLVIVLQSWGPLVVYDIEDFRAWQAYEWSKSHAEHCLNAAISVHDRLHLVEGLASKSALNWWLAVARSKKIKPMPRSANL